MNAPTLAASPSDAAVPSAEDTAYYRQALHELIEMGLDMARLVHGQAKAQAEAATKQAGPAGADGSVAFDRLARAVRRTVALARRLDEPVRAGREGAPRHLAARRQILRAVEDVIQREAADQAEEDGLNGELYERLDAPELDDELDCRPVAEIVADICRDLGIAELSGTGRWKRRFPAEVAALCARAARVTGSQATPEDSARGEAVERFFRIVASPGGGERSLGLGAWPALTPTLSRVGRERE